LDGRVDRETLLSWLPNIDDPARILEKLEEEKEHGQEYRIPIPDDEEDEE